MTETDAQRMSEANDFEERAMRDVFLACQRDATRARIGYALTFPDRQVRGRRSRRIPDPSDSLFLGAAIFFRRIPNYRDPIVFVLRDSVHFYAFGSTAFHFFR